MFQKERERERENLGEEGDISKQLCWGYTLTVGSITTDPALPTLMFCLLPYPKIDLHLATAQL